MDRSRNAKRARLSGDGLATTPQEPPMPEHATFTTPDQDELEISVFHVTSTPNGRAILKLISDIHSYKNYRFGLDCLIYFMTALNYDDEADKKKCLDIMLSKLPGIDFPENPLDYNWGTWENRDMDMSMDAVPVSGIHYWIPSQSSDD